MDMVPHQSVGIDTAGSAVFVTGEQKKVFLIISGIFEYVLFLIPSGNHMVKGTCVLDAGLSCHVERVAEHRGAVNISIFKSDPVYRFSFSFILCQRS
jgi:hypothetical protein